MFEARITYYSGRTHIVEANTIETLKSKCQPFIGSINIISIEVIKLDHYGYFKNELLDEEDLL